MPNALILVFAFLAIATSAQASTLVYCSEASPSSFNPQLATDGTTFNASSRIVYNRLVEFKYGETTILPALAEKWDVSKDGLTVTFKLRKGVKFHTTPYFTPTRDFNADDVLFSFNRQRQKEHPFHKVSGGSYEYFNSMEMNSLITDLQKKDDYTVVFKLAKPEAPFLANLAMDFASILSAEYAEKMRAAGTPEKMDQMPVGTGPFLWQSYVKDNTIRYSSHPQYWGGKTKLDRVIFAITPDPSVRFQKLKAGECHIATEPAPADLAEMRKNPNLVVMERPGLNVAYLAFNVQKKPFDSALVRQAMNHALNRASYIDAIYLGNGKVAKNPMPPTLWSYNDAVKDYDYNPTKAKELLAKAGLPNGFETELWTMPVSRPYNPNGKKMGELMQADLAKVGIKAKLVSYDWPTYLQKSKDGEHALLQMGWTGDNGDPDNFLMLLSCSGVEAGANRARWCNKKFDDLLLQARTTSDVKKRTALYKEAQQLFKKDAPWVTLAHSVVFRATSKKVSGYKIDPFGGDMFTSVELK